MKERSVGNTVLVVDAGGRGATLVDKYAQSEHVERIIAVPGNDLMKINTDKPVQTHPQLKTTSVPEILEICEREQIGLVDVAQDKRDELAYRENAYDLDTLISYKKETAKKRKSYLEELSRIQQKATKISIKNIPIDEYCAEVKEVYMTLNTSNQALLIRDIIDKIVLKGHKNEVDVYGHLTLNHLNMCYGITDRDSWSTKCRKINSF